jgi:hypothetical protein
LHFPAENARASDGSSLRHILRAKRISLAAGAGEVDRTNQVVIAGGCLDIVLRLAFSLKFVEINNNPKEMAAKRIV